MKIAKLILALTWVFFIAAQFVPALAPYSQIALYGLMFLVVGHITEFLIFLPLIKKAPESMGYHFFQTLIFGVLQYFELKQYKDA